MMAKSSNKKIEFRNRIKGFREVPARDLKGAPWNWRRHPEAQRAALAGSLAELGFFDPLDVRELPDGSLELIDGHLRRDLIGAAVGPDTLIPCVVTDFTEEEAKKANLLKDPLAAMAQADAGALEALLSEVSVGSEALQGMLDDLAKQAGILPDGGEEGGEDDDKPTPDTSPQLGGMEYRVVVDCADEAQQGELIARLEAEGFACRPLMS